MDRTELATTLQFGFNNYPDSKDFRDFLSRALPEDCQGLTHEQRLHFAEIKKWIAANNAAKARQFAMLLVHALPQSPSRETTNLKLNWVVAVCAVLGIVLTVVPLFKVQGASTGSEPAKNAVQPTERRSVDPASHPSANGTAALGKPRDSPRNIPPVMAILHSVQLGVILVLAGVQSQWLRAAGKRIKSSMLIAAGTLVQFQRGWTAIWWTWAALYAWFAYAAAVVHQETTTVLAVGDVVNSITGIAIWWCFLALDLPSVNLPGQMQRDHSFRRAVSLAVAAGLVCGAFGCADRYLNLGHFGVTMVGAFNGLGLACLVGRFTSHWMMVPRSQILFLYTYSMLQLIYPFFDLLGNRWEMGVYVMVLILKVMLANTLRSMVQEGGLDNYLEAAQDGRLGFPQKASAAQA